MNRMIRKTMETTRQVNGADRDVRRGAEPASATVRDDAFLSLTGCDGGTRRKLNNI